MDFRWISLQFRRVLWAQSPFQDPQRSITAWSLEISPPNRSHTPCSAPRAHERSSRMACSPTPATKWAPKSGRNLEQEAENTSPRPILKRTAENFPQEPSERSSAHGASEGRRDSPGTSGARTPPCAAPHEATAHESSPRPRSLRCSSPPSARGRPRGGNVVGTLALKSFLGRVEAGAERTRWGSGTSPKAVL